MRLFVLHSKNSTDLDWYFLLLTIKAWKATVTSTRFEKVKTHRKYWFQILTQAQQFQVGVSQLHQLVPILSTPPHPPTPPKRMKGKVDLSRISTQNKKMNKWLLNIFSSILLMILPVYHPWPKQTSQSILSSVHFAKPLFFLLSSLTIRKIIIKLKKW